MSYKYFVIIKEVTGNYLMSFIIKGANYLTIVKLDVLDLRPLLISRINHYKDLMTLL